MGVRAVLAESYERMHRSHMVGMGVLPLQFSDGETAESLGLTGQEMFSIPAINADTKTLKVTAEWGDGQKTTFTVKGRIDTPNEFSYFQHRGILNYVLRSLDEK